MGIAGWLTAAAAAALGTGLLIGGAAELCFRAGFGKKKEDEEDEHD